VPWEPRTELTGQEFTAAIAATTVTTSIATSITSVAGLGTPVISPKSDYGDTPLSASGDGTISESSDDSSISMGEGTNTSVSGAKILITPATPSPKSQSSTSSTSQSWRSDAMLAAVSTPRHVPGVRVTHEHAWMYFCDASKTHLLKCSLRERHLAAAHIFTSAMNKVSLTDEATTPSAPTSTTVSP
jgi:hypothetical protein